MSAPDTPSTPTGDYEDDELECTFCGGEGFTECDDPLQCFSPMHMDDDWCECTACNGRGYGQVIW